VISSFPRLKLIMASASSGIHNMAEQGETPCLDNSRKVWLLGSPYHNISIICTLIFLVIVVVDQLMVVGYTLIMLSG